MKHVLHLRFYTKAFEVCIDCTLTLLISRKKETIGYTVHFTYAEGSNIYELSPI